MIKRGAKLWIELVPLSHIVVSKFDVRFPGTLNSYIDLLIKNPECDPEPLHVSPSKAHEGIYELLNGYHRFLAAIATGRHEVMCIVEEAGEEVVV